MKTLTWIPLVIVMIIMMGCASTSKKVAKQETYQLNEKTDYVKKAAKGFKQRGQASWYGQAFHGRRTASGERFNMHQMTAAHSTLPLSTYVRVTNLENDESVIVRINDRMPRHKNRIIDVSYAAAKALGMQRAGLAQVEVEQVHLRER